jgi:hypothetical protein
MDPAQRRQTRYKLQAESDSRVIETMAPNLGKQQLDALRAELKRKRDRTYGDRAAGATKNQSGG